MKQSIAIKNSNHRERTIEAIGVKVMCVQTGVVFRTLKSASEWAHTKCCSITEVCKNQRIWAGKHPITKEKLTWKYME